jgi:glutamate racemase
MQRLIADHAHGVEVRVESCPDWATRVESLNLDDPDLIADVRQKIGTLLAWGADRIVLGCTHYSFLAPVMLPLIAGKSVLIEVAEAVARQTQRLAGASAQGRGGLTMKASAYPERLRAALPALGLERLAARLVD